MKKYNNNNNNTAESGDKQNKEIRTFVTHLFLFFTNRLRSYSGAWSIEGIEFDANLCSKMSKITGDLL